MRSLLTPSSYAGSVCASPFEGRWHTIEYQPDLSVPQHFIIGVALSTGGVLTHFSLARHAENLRRFYGDRLHESTWTLLVSELSSELKAALGTRPSRFESRSPQVRLGEAFFIAGDSAEEALQRTFARVVVVEDSAARSQGDQTQ